MAKQNKFIQVIKGFVKRNAYALAVSFSVLAVFAVITAISVADLYKVENTNQTVEEEQGETTPTGNTDVIIFESPVKNGTVCKEYAEDYLIEDKTTGVWKTHQAIDYCGPEGTEVCAAYKGTVQKVEKNIMDGTVVTIEHASGLKTVYKALASASVTEGEEVDAGEVIGVMGTSTSEKAEGTHLHFEVMLNDKLVNPNLYIATNSK